MEKELRKYLNKRLKELEKLQLKADALPNPVISPADRETLELFQSIGEKHHCLINGKKFVGWLTELHPKAAICADSGPVASDELFLVPLDQIDLSQSDFLMGETWQPFKRSEWLAISQPTSEEALEEMLDKFAAAGVLIGSSEALGLKLWVRNSQIEKARACLQS